MAKSMFAALNKAKRNSKATTVSTNLASAVRQMRCPHCGNQPKPSIRITEGVVHCPHCQWLMFVLPEPGPNFVDEYKELAATDDIIKAVARWFPRDNVIAAGYFLGWLGQRLAMEQA